MPKIKVFSVLYKSQNEQSFMMSIYNTEMITQKGVTGLNFLCSN